MFTAFLGELMLIPKLRERFFRVREPFPSVRTVFRLQISSSNHHRNSNFLMLPRLTFETDSRMIELSRQKNGAASCSKAAPIGLLS